MNYQNVKFKLSAAKADQFPRDGIPQIAFAGKSNVGKSSVINRVLQRKNLAFVGSSPGKTIHINYFLVDETAYLVDLPGYGYAKVSRSEKERWSRLMESYFSSPELITLGILIVDARHAPTQNDVIMANWFQQSGCPFAVVANKLDKLKKSQISSNIDLIRQDLSLSDDTILLPFSAEKGTNRDELIGIIEHVVCGKSIHNV